MRLFLTILFIPILANAFPHPNEFNINDKDDSDSYYVIAKEIPLACKQTRKSICNSSNECEVYTENDDVDWGDVGIILKEVTEIGSKSKNNSLKLADDTYMMTIEGMDTPLIPLQGNILVDKKTNVKFDQYVGDTTFTLNVSSGEFKTKITIDELTLIDVHNCSKSESLLD